MSYKIITISRQFGSGGRTIGKEVAAKLGIPCYDQELITMMAEESGFSVEQVKELDEKEVRKKFFTTRAERALNSSYLQSALWIAQEKMILQLAEKGACVIVGRCADRILKDRDDVLRVFIHADEQKRAQRIVEVYGETDDEPIDRIYEKDKLREGYYERYTHDQWGDAKNFHIALDSGELGIDFCVDLLEKLYKAE
ncbi:MAG: cytidylate kinase-like family protein [Firmicutes bacterium]|nr:cytidylate kinase-like family protein [Bacillota bacterium]MBR7148700.1 cytidylate kinase-like family protein [Bacillota bacterium]